MPMIKEIIQNSYLIVVAGITLLIFLFYNSALTAKRKMAFLIGVIIAMVMIICNIMVYLFTGTGKNIMLMKIFSAISYSISGPVMLPFIFLTNVIKKKARTAVLCLAIFNVLLCIISIFNGCIFVFDETGNRYMGKFALVPYLLSFIYIALLLVASINKFRLGFKNESYFIFLLSVAIVIATIMNAVFHFKFLISGMAVLSCLFYYIFFTTETLTRDALTGAFNRHSFYKDVENMKKHQMFVISMDLNGLKRINDTEGHDAGDRAILSVSDSAFEVLPMKCRFYRMGGDEFEILYPHATYSDVELTTNKLKEAVHKKGYSIAIGFGEYKKGMDFDNVFREVDAMMYEDKARMKAADPQLVNEIPNI